MRVRVPRNLNINVNEEVRRLHALFAKQRIKEDIFVLVSHSDFLCLSPNLATALLVLCSDTHDMIVLPKRWPPDVSLMELP